MEQEPRTAPWFCKARTKRAAGPPQRKQGEAGRGLRAGGAACTKGARHARISSLSPSHLPRMRGGPEAVRAAMAMAEKFDSLEEHLEKFVENIRQLGIIVSDFQPSSQAGLNQKL